MHFFLLTAFRSVRSALVRDQGREEPCDVPFWRLWVEEFPVLARRVGRMRVSVAISGFFFLLLVAEIALNEATPGPFLSPRWRIAVAFAATGLFVLSWSLVHAMRSVRADGRER